MISKFIRYTKNLCGNIRFSCGLTLFLLLITTGCNFIASCEDDDALRKTRMALSVQQTLLAEEVQKVSRGDCYCPGSDHCGNRLTTKPPG